MKISVLPTVLPEIAITGQIASRGLQAMPCSCPFGQ
jgi:hypothetical protein